MRVTAYKTPKIVPGNELTVILDKHLPAIPEKSVVIVTSKIVSVCEGRVIKNDGKVDKINLIKNEATLYMDASDKWGIMLTVKNDILIASSGIDESNGNGYFILWPKDPFATAADIWHFLREKNKVKNLGVIIADSHTTPLRWGITGIGIAWCGFTPLKNYIGTPDIFGRHLHVTKASIVDGLAASAVVTMGEGNEQTPLAVIEDLPFVRFTSDPPTANEIRASRISIQEDIFSPLLTSTRWKKGHSK